MDKPLRSADNPPVTSRLQRFRACMARLDPAADPGEAIERGWHVELPGATIERLKARLELRPRSSHVLLGQIGSGKTTQLRLLERALSASDTVVIYVDVAQWHEGDIKEAGLLLVLAALSLLDLEAVEGDEDIDAIAQEFRRWAFGYPTIERRLVGGHATALARAMETSLHVSTAAPEYKVVTVRKPGLVKRPSHGLHGRASEMSGKLATLVRRTYPDRTVVFLIDGLDRLPRIDGWQTILQNDLQGISRAGAGVVVVGPLTLLYGSNRPLTEVVDRTHRQPILQPGDGSTDALLTEVLTRRVGDLFDEAAIEAVCARSGGVLRDLISLARSALEEAYVAGRDQVTPADVELAASTFGRDLMMGLTETDLEVLERVRRDGTFIPTSDESFALLLSRRVLEYGAGPHTYAVHPTIEPLLAQLAA